MDKYFEELKNKIHELDLNNIQKIADLIKNCKGIIYIIGNGGSATTASHFAIDLSKGAGIKAISLCANSGLITAISNDLNFIYSYSEQVKLFIKKKDILIVISVSGDSLNLVKAAIDAKRKKAKIIGLLGKDGGTVKHYCDESIIIESDNYGIVEDLHLVLTHFLSNQLIVKE